MALRAALDAIVYSSVWAGAAAVALMSAATLALGARVRPAALALALGGTLVVYTVDRLRDLERDRATTPARSRFVARHRGALALLGGAGAVASAASLVALPLRVAMLAAAVLAVGLAHRRIKHVAGLKTTYVALAWTCVCVGVPALAEPVRDVSRIAGVAGVLALSIAANVVLSNLRDGEGASARAPLPIALAFAGAMCAAAALACSMRALALPPALAAVPIAEGLAVAGFATRAARRQSELYGLVVADGALVAGGLAAAAWLA